MKFVNVINEMVGHSHVQYMSSVAVFTYFSRLVLPTFPPHCMLPLQPLDVAIVGHFNPYLAKVENMVSSK